MDYAQLSACTLHLKRVDPERLNNEEQIATQKRRLTLLCAAMDLTPLDINIKRSVKRKGQAFITFSTPADAAKARGFLRGFPMVKGGRGMEVEVARGAADVLVEKECKEKLEEHVRARKADKDRKKTVEPSRPSSTHPSSAAAKRPGAPLSSKPSKALKPSASAPGKAAIIPDEYLPPNKILFVRNVPDGFSPAELEELFARFPGFREVRVIPLPQYKGAVFVEYEANEGAIQAREVLNGRVVGGDEGKPLLVTYQKAVGAG